MKTWTSRKETNVKRKLGNSGIEVSALGMGCWAIGGVWTGGKDNPMGWGQVDDAESLRAINQAIDLGVTLFDTSNIYGAGHSERILGKGIAGQRDKVVIATKFGYFADEETKKTSGGDASPEAVRRSCEESLRRLDTDYIDLFQFHWGDYDPEEALEVRHTLEELVQEGKIRAYGWSTDRLDRARVFAQGEHCASIQHTLNINTPAPEMLALCEEFGLASINKKPLWAGILTGKFTAGDTFAPDDMRSVLDFTNERGQAILQKVEALREVLTQDGRSMAQGALGWIWALSDIAIPIPGFKTVEQVKENAAALEYGPLSDEQMQEIDRLIELVPTV